MDGKRNKAEGAERLPESVRTREKEEAKEEAKEGKRTGTSTLPKALFFGAVYALWGYLAGGVALPFAAKPFGVALLCASDRRVLWILAGLCASAWFDERRLFLLIVYGGAVLCRLLVRFALDAPWSEEENAEAGEKRISEVWHLFFSEHISLRAATAAIAVFAVGLDRLIRGGFLYYDLYGTMLSVIAAPTAVLLFSGFFSDTAAGYWRRQAGLLSIAFVLLLAAKGMTLYGVSLGALGCMLLTLYLTRKQGILSGVIGGTVTGLALSVSLAPLFAFSALAAGLLYAVAPVLALTAACSVSIAWGFYTQGIGALTGLAPALFGACVLFGVLDKLFFSAKAKEAEATEESAKAIPREETVALVAEASGAQTLRLADTHRRIKLLCEGFSSLSEVFWGLSRRMQSPTEADLRQICDRAFEDSCATCAERSACWGERYHLSAGELNTLSAILHRNGHLTTSDAPRDLSARCDRLPDILEEINHRATRRAGELLQGDRTEVFAQDYESISEILAAAMVEQTGEYEIDEDTSRRLCEALSDPALGVCGVCALGKGRRRIALSLSRTQGIDRDRICRKAEAILGVPLRIGEGSEETTLVLEEAQTLAVSCAKRTLCAEGEEQYCGDTVNLFRDPDGTFYALINDGMGSGREAAMTSGISGLFLRRMIGAGIPCETALKMLNGFLRNRGSGSLHECSSTVDLMELDLLRGRASFYKSGAAPTYVFRSGSLFKLRSHTVPVGIIKQTDMKRIRFEVAAGDVVVMISDGVTGGREECPWLFDLLRSQGDSASAERLADLIVKYAKGEGCRDDLSVLIVKIKEAERRES